MARGSTASSATRATCRRPRRMLRRRTDRRRSALPDAPRIRRNGRRRAMAEVQARLAPRRGGGRGADTVHGNERRPRRGRVIRFAELSGGDVAEPSACDRSGHDLDARISVRRGAAAGRLRAARVSADLSAARLGRARSAGHLDHVGRDRARRDGERRRRGRGCRGDRHHQPARDHDHLGPRDRQADPQCDRLAGPPHARRLRGAGARRP